MAGKLTLYPTQGASRHLILHEGKDYRGGRDPTSDLFLEDPCVSAQHSVFQWTGNGWQVVDVGSKNGTFVNGLRAKETVLRHEDWISFGGLLARYETVTEEQVESLVDERTVRLQSSRDALREIVAAGEPQILLRRLIESILTLTGAERGFIVLLQEGGGLKAEVAAGFDPFESVDDRYAGSLGAIEKVLHSGKPVIVSDAKADDFLRERRSVIDLGIGALACVPLRGDGQVAGVIYVDGRKQGGTFTELDLEILESIADHASLVLAGIQIDRQIRHLVGASGQTVESGKPDFLTELRRKVSLITGNYGGEAAPAGGSVKREAPFTRAAGVTDQSAINESPIESSPSAGKQFSATATNVDPTQRLSVGARLAGRYTILGIAGAGGMGVVYRARDEELGMDVALKVLRSDLGGNPLIIERFRAELKLGRQVSHKNVVRIHDIGEHEGLRFLTMEFVEGRSLREILEREVPLPLDRAIAIVRQLAAALAEAHEADIVHRDLKPGNILIDASGNAFITDFGVARSLVSDGLTRAGAIVGTPDYLSPEQIAGDPVDGRTDLYALGIVFYEMLSGELPFRGGSQAEMLGQRLAGQTRDITETGIRVPSYIRAVLRRCLQRSPARRYANARAMIADLEARRRPTARRRVSFALLMVAAISAAILIGVFYHDRLRTPGRPPSVSPVPTLAGHAVAILPLLDETGETSLAWTSTGIAEMLAANLFESKNLRVLDSQRVLSVLRDLHVEKPYDDRALREMANLWGVNVLVAGAVRRAGSAMRIDLRLVRVDSTGMLSTRFVTADTSSEGGLFNLVNDLANKLRIELGHLEVPRADGFGSETSSLEAARAYEEGRLLLLRGDDLGASPLLERAVAADPKFAAAMERLAETYQSLGYHDKALASGESALKVVGDRESRVGYRIRGRVALLKGNPKEAERSYEEMLRRYPYDVEAGLDLAAAQAAQGHSTQAIQTLNRVVQVDPNDPRAWFLLGKNSILIGESSVAVKDYLVRALALQSHLGNEKGKGDVLNAMGVAYQQLGDFPQALENYTAASAIRKKLGDDRGLASTLRNRANVYNSMGRSLQAQADLRVAQRLFERIGDRNGLAEVMNDFGVLHEGRGEYARALDAYQSALKIRRTLGDERLLAQSYDNVGYIFFLQGEYDHAFVYWQEALDLRRKTGEKNGMILTEQSLGFLQIAQGKWDDATKSFLDALEQSRGIGFQNAAAISLGNLAVLNHYRGRYKAAFDSFQEALGLAQKLDLKPVLAEFTLKEAEALLEIGQVDAVKERLDRAEPWVRETGNREQAADLEVLRGGWLAARGEKDAARKAYARAIPLAQESGSKVAWLRARIASDAARAEWGEASAALALSSDLAEAKSIGHFLLTIRSAEALARAELGRRKLSSAVAAVQKALDPAEESRWVAGLYRLHALQGQILEARGDAAAAKEPFARSVQEIAEIRAGLTKEQQSSFEGLPTVRQIERWKSRQPKQ